MVNYLPYVTPYAAHYPHSLGRNSERSVTHMPSDIERPQNHQSPDITPAPPSHVSATGLDQASKASPDELVREFSHLMSMALPDLSKAPQIAAITDRENQLLGTAFGLTFDALKNRDRSDINAYTALLEKYSIENPLEAGREVLDRMTIYEETIFNQMTEMIKSLSLSALRTEDLLVYLQLTRMKSDQLTEMALSLIQDPAKREETSIAVKNRHEEIYALMNNSTYTPPEVEPLCNRTKHLLEELFSTVRKLSDVMESGSQENIKTGMATIERITNDLIEHVRQSFIDAYAESPTEQEQALFNNTLETLAEIQFTDEAIRFYSRLSVPAISQQEISLLLDIWEHRESLPGTSGPLDLASGSSDLLISAYEGNARKMLEVFREECQRGRTDIINNDSGYVSAGYSRSTALFYAMEAAGFDPSELDKLMALNAFESTSEALRQNITDNSDNLAQWCLEEISKLYGIRYSERYNGLPEAEKRHISSGINDLSCILASQYDCPVTQDHVLELSRNPDTARLIESQLREAYYTPEKYDDADMHRQLYMIRSLSGNAFDWSVSVIDHLSIMRMLGRPVDEQFVSDMLNLPKEGTIGDISRSMMDCFSYLSLEWNAEQKPNFEGSKRSLMNNLSKFIETEIRQKSSADPTFMGSAEAQEKLGYLGYISNILMQTTVISENDMILFLRENPIQEPVSGLSFRSFSSGGTFHTRGIENIPREILEAIEQHPASYNFLKENQDLLDIYWVPFEPTNNGFGGYATADRNTFVVVYNSEDGEVRSPRQAAGILLHELQHKVDYKQLAEYKKSNPGFPFNGPSTLITESNAWKRMLHYYESLPADTEGLDDFLVSRAVVESAIYLLGEDIPAEKMLAAPYEGIDIHSYSMNIYPPAVTAEQISELDLLLGKMGYASDEKRWLMERILGVFDKTPIDLSNNLAGQRDLFEDFIRRCMGPKFSEASTSVIIETISLVRTALLEEYKNSVDSAFNEGEITKDEHEQYNDYINALFTATASAPGLIDRYSLEQLIITAREDLSAS